MSGDGGFQVLDYVTEPTHFQMSEAQAEEPARRP